MNRRRFLSLLGQAAAGATVAYSFPSIIVPKNIQPVVDSYFMAPQGLAWLINDGADLRGLSMSTFPDLNGPVMEYSGAVLSPQMFEDARRRLSQMFFQTNANPMLYPQV